MSYFHTGIRTIIGAEAFHCPVRDGKEWDHLAMVIRHNWFLLAERYPNAQCRQFLESNRMIVFWQIVNDVISLWCNTKVIGSSRTGN